MWGSEKGGEKVVDIILYFSRCFELLEKLLEHFNTKTQKIVKKILFLPTNKITLKLQIIPNLPSRFLKSLNTLSKSFLSFSCKSKKSQSLNFFFIPTPVRHTLKLKSCYMQQRLARTAKKTWKNCNVINTENLCSQKYNFSSLPEFLFYSRAAKRNIVPMICLVVYILLVTTNN